jgi:hypothetical protein
MIRSATAIWRAFQDKVIAEGRSTLLILSLFKTNAKASASLEFAMILPFILVGTALAMPVAQYAFWSIENNQILETGVRAARFDPGSDAVFNIMAEAVRDKGKVPFTPRPKDQWPINGVLVTADRGCKCVGDPPNTWSSCPGMCPDGRPKTVLYTITTRYNPNASAMRHWQEVGHRVIAYLWKEETHYWKLIPDVGTGRTVVVR